MELVKREDHYALYDDNGQKIAASIDGCMYKLSEENCSEIFGIVDVEKLTKEYVDADPDLEIGTSEYQNAQVDFKEGFNRAMELNKDKLFTVEDMKKAIAMARKGSKERLHDGYGSFTQPIFVLNDTSSEEIIQSLQPPTEIEVEIVTTEIVIAKFHKAYTQSVYELDKDGCLILKKL